MSKSQVTERDIRLPQFRDANIEDLEFDGTGEVVRKDRFETSMRRIYSVLHGVNGLSPRDGWTCEQVVGAVKDIKNKLDRIRELNLVLEKWPADADFYHSENKWFVKNIDQEHLEIAKKQPELNHLVNHEVLDWVYSEEYEPNSASLEYIDVLMSTDDVRKELELIMRGESDQHLPR